MPRPRTELAMWALVAFVCVASPTALRTAALAATAGTLFEAIPFVLGAALLPRGRASRFLSFLGCGCARTGPGALALPAIGVCWLAFGPLVALARAAAGLAVAVALETRERRAHAATLARARPDPLAELGRLGPQALAGALLSEGIRAFPFAGLPAPVAASLSLGAGLVLGALLPCATGGVALAAGLRGILPAATAGILVSAGIVRFPVASRLGALGDELTPLGHGRLAYALLAAACALIAWRGPSGFVNPRFVVPIGLAGIVAGMLALRPRFRTTSRIPAVLPALLVLVTLAGSPLPERAPIATTLDDPYPGEAIRFVGALAAWPRPATSATLVRYTITCCRADAQARAVRLDRSLTGSPGSWYEASGELVRARDGALVLHVTTARRIPAPADPFAYR